MSYNADYEYRIPSADELRSQRETASKENLKISIVVPTYETPQDFLTELLQSVTAQSDPHWELILADASTSDTVKKTLGAFVTVEGKAYAGQIFYHKLSANRGIAENTNEGIQTATGDYVGLLDHDDLLTPDAVYHVRKTILQGGVTRDESVGSQPEQSPGAAGTDQAIDRIEPQHLHPGAHQVELVYSDEDKYDGDTNRYYDPNVKSGFDIDALMSNNYVCHFTVIHRERLNQLLLRAEYDGAQDHDLVLRVAGILLDEDVPEADLGKRMVHIPRVLYHWRCHSASTAANPASKLYAYEAGKRAVADFVRQQGWKAEVMETAHVGFFRVNYGTTEGLFRQRPQVGAIGGKVVDRAHNVISGNLDARGNCVLGGLKDDYAGPCNRADIVSGAYALDARSIILRDELVSLYMECVGLPYPKDTDARDEAFCNQLDERIWRQRSLDLSRRIREAGYVLLWDPEVKVSI